MITKKIIYGCDARVTGEVAYMTRYILLRTKIGELCLHVFHRSDERVLHDHPWDFWTLVLWRGYRENTPSGSRAVRPGMILHRPAEWQHFVTLFEKNGHARPAVTLIWKRIRRREWDFIFSDGKRMGWREYFNKFGCK